MDEDVETLIPLAMEQLREGRTEDALLTLERTVRPKYNSAEDAAKALSVHGPLL